MKNLNLVELTQEELEQTNGGICFLALICCLATLIVIAINET